MTIIFWKWKVWTALSELLTYLEEDFLLMDDQDYNDEQLNNAKQIIVSPGIPPHHKLYQNHNNKIISELNFLWKLLDSKNIRKNFTMIGISWTNGKSTTTHVLYNLLNKLESNVHLSGNFGTPLSSTILEIMNEERSTKNEKRTIVLEVSSFMLYKLKDFHFDYSILTNIETDHLDRHPDFEDYKKAKLNLIKFTNKKAYTTQKVYDQLPEERKTKTEIYDHNYDLTGTKFVGHHNKANLEVCYKLTQEISPSTNHELLTTYLKEIKPLAHRMQLYATIDGIQFFDDGICTSSHAQENALKGFDQKIILIAWGYDKWDDFTYLGPLYKEKIGYGIFIWNTAPKFEKIFDDQNIFYQTQNSLEEAIHMALDRAKHHELPIILFSPGCASFDMFKNVYDRIAQFEEIIKKLQ